ncbi:hypothetical protein SSX86_028766 [Deinandra increscens subsp. villosa]|uniref:Pectate lyase n=1 Tax=Deinandra increscens subsp. villosa TaxID=3103831 RepID=A0AAP0GJK8_9ASTR
MATIPLGSHLHHRFRLEISKFEIDSRKFKHSSLCSSSKRSSLLKNGAKIGQFRPCYDSRVLNATIRASATSSSSDTAVLDAEVSDDVIFRETFPLQRIHKVEGKIMVRLDGGSDEENWQLTVGCNLPGKWVLHWGVNYVNDIGSEWDQPPVEMRPLDSIAIKDYAIETPFTKSSTIEEADTLNEVNIAFNSKSAIAAINFVLKDEESGSWYQYRGRDFKVRLVNFSNDDDNAVGNKQGFAVWPGPFSSMMIQSEDTHSEGKNENENGNLEESIKSFYEEHPIIQATVVENSMNVYVKRCTETSSSLVNIETDIPDDVIVHWGISKDDSKKWEIPSGPYPANTHLFKNKALRTQLQQKEGGNGCYGVFPLDEETAGFLFVLKLNDNTWINYTGNDFYIPISKENKQDMKVDEEDSVYTDEIINEIRHLVSGISSEVNQKTKSKEVQETILQEIEKLAAEAYGIFRSSIPTVPEIIEEAVDIESPVKISSATGSGFEILLQGFNWESNKSGKWYVELEEKAAELATLGFTIVWLPPPTESISAEGYMPRDLYNLNSRYGNVDELKSLVKKFHQVGIRTLGDAVINHRCAHYQNQNGIWNIYGGLLNWDDRAVVSDDPHFQGRGNKSSGDNFHAAPNIDHSQEFVRKDLSEWLRWLRKEIGYDGWRLDYVRGFWGGYVKEYMEASKPYFSVGEYWDSLCYTYGEMDHNQDAHRQRIVDWINDTNGTAGAFDVTTKGIFHSAIERCEYWRLSDSNGKPPGVLGWWPSRAVTFIENHDTGSTQGHWRFPGGKEMQGYAYILTHPGTPSVFYDHLFSRYKSEISALISLRKRNKINCRSTVKIKKAERDVYAALIDEKVVMKIGPGHYEPESGSQKWSLAVQGNDYKVHQITNNHTMGKYCYVLYFTLAFALVADAARPGDEADMAEGGLNSTRRELSGCTATNVIDKCWRCKPDWADNRQALAQCVAGFATGTTGGSGGDTYTVTTAEDDPENPKEGMLRFGVTQSRPLWIVFEKDMVIALTQELVVNSDKTIDGRGAKVEITGGGITMVDVKNIIIINLNIHDVKEMPGGMIKSTDGPATSRQKSDGDNIQISGCTKVWVDHCSLSKGFDGLIDVTLGSSYVTISNNKFTQHSKVMLLGADDGHHQDKNMQATVAFNLFTDNCDQRMPRCRFGFFQVVNNNYDKWGTYAIGGSSAPTILSQGNKFLAPDDANKKNVLVRADAPEAESMTWNWRSEKDSLENGAIFLASGADPALTGEQQSMMIAAEPGESVAGLTSSAGVLPCVAGSPC